MDPWLINIAFIVVNLIIGTIGFLIRSHLLSIKAEIQSLKHDIKDVKAQVYLTNGRVNVMEEWRRNHEAADDKLHDTLDIFLQSVMSKVDKLWHGEGNGK